jgi:hypothetical protein
MSHFTQVILTICFFVVPVLIVSSIWSRNRMRRNKFYRVEMFFGDEPTAAADQAAIYLRRWYEGHRESWWDRHCGPGWPVGPGTDRSGAHADEFMLDLLNEVYLINSARKAEDEKRLRKASSL